MKLRALGDNVFEVEHGYVEPGYRGRPRLCLRGPLTAAAVRWFHRNPGVRGIWMCDAEPMPGVDCFWSPSRRCLARLRELELDEVHANSWRKGLVTTHIADLSGIKALSLGLPLGGLLSLAACSKLVALTVDLTKSKAGKLEGLSQAKRMTSCTLFGATTANVLELQGLPSLPVLELLRVHGALPIGGFAQMRELQYLRLGLIRGAAIDWREFASRSLDSLTLDGVSGLQSLAFVEGLPRLRRLVLNDCGCVDSIRPLRKTKLQVLRIGGNTVIEDGDLRGGLTRNMTCVSIRDRSHYRPGASVVMRTGRDAKRRHPWPPSMALDLLLRRQGIGKTVEGA